MKTALIWPDTHIPYHSRKAVKLLLSVIKHLKPDEIVFLGDLADFYAVNSHGKHASMLHLLKSEVEAVNKFLDQIDKIAPKSRKVYLEGNHEFRLERFICNTAPALFGVTEIRNLFKLDQRPNWKWVPYGPKQSYRVLDSKLKARHEPLGPNAKLSASRSICNLVYGHIHRIESGYVVGLDQTQYINFSPGWLGDFRFDKVFGYVKSHQWQLGFSIVHVNPVNGYFYPQIVPILPDMTCVLNGKVFKP